MYQLFSVILERFTFLYCTYFWQFEYFSHNFLPWCSPQTGPHPWVSPDEVPLIRRCWVCRCQSWRRIRFGSVDFVHVQQFTENKNHMFLCVISVFLILLLTLCNYAVWLIIVLIFDYFDYRYWSYFVDLFIYSTVTNWVRFPKLNKLKEIIASVN